MAKQRTYRPARACQFVVRVKPAVDMDGANRCIHDFGLHDGDDLRDFFRQQMRKLAVISRRVSFAPSAVLRQYCNPVLRAIRAG